MKRALTSTQVVTYSPALTLVPTYECFNRCQYCNFRVDPLVDRWMSLQAAEERLQVAESQSLIEILILSGEVHPQSPRRAAWLQRIYDIGELALRMGFLPHTNVGPLSPSEMAFLKQVNVSMGLMLEQITPTLLKGVHRHAPSKSPELRLQQLEQAGQLKIPFTTGLLLGIGESALDRIETLKAIAACHQRWGHIQEVILQPHQPGTYQLQTLPAFTADDLANFVSTARQYLPADITLQIPPNLVTDQSYLLAAIANGARDLGGIGPIDEVNPDYHHPKLFELKHQLHNAGLIMRPRLPVYPRYDSWLATAPRQKVDQWRLSLQDMAAIPQLPISRPEDR
ncbi:MAG: 7,8-didemethyl-8-hydroxy-5-deazariboflavin synthase subunit CofG [Cyanobacteria bacterium J06626_4]